MKRLYTLISSCATLFVFLNACQQTIITQPLPESAKLLSLPGEYTITGTASYTIAGVVSSAPLSGTLSVTPGEVDQHYLFSENLQNATLNFHTQHAGQAFAIQPVWESLHEGLVSYYGTSDKASCGTALNGRIQYDRFFTLQGENLNSSGAKAVSSDKVFRKHIHINANKITR